MKKTHNLVAVTGTYTDGQGQEKKRYVTIGAAFEREDGSMSLKIESIPVGSDWNGWVNLYEPRQQDKPASTAPAAPAREPGSDDGEFRDDTLDGIGDPPNPAAGEDVGKVPFGD